jgi:hypothetical protein
MYIGKIQRDTITIGTWTMPVGYEPVFSFLPKLRIANCDCGYFCTRYVYTCVRCGSDSDEGEVIGLHRYLLFGNPCMVYDMYYMGSKYGIYIVGVGIKPYFSAVVVVHTLYCTVHTD